MVSYIERFRDLAQTCAEIRNRNDCAERKDEYYEKVVRNFQIEMEKIRRFINDAFKEELPHLGTPYPYIIPSDWGYIRQRTPKNFSTRKLT